MGLFGFDFYPIFSKNVSKQAAFSPAFRHRVFVARGEYTGVRIPQKSAPAVRFQKISPVLLLAPRVACPPRPLPPRLLPDL
jgi:hypothetical protein